MTEEIFDLDRLVMNDSPREVVVEGVGKIRYCPLTTIDMVRLTSIEDEIGSFGFRAVFVMLQKANPTFSMEKWEKFPPKTSNRIIEALVKDADFLENSSEGQSLKADS